MFANSGKNWKCIVQHSTGEEPIFNGNDCFEAKKLNKNINASIIATDIDTNVLQYANGIYRYSKSSKEFPEWIKPQKYFKRRIQKLFLEKKFLIKSKWWFKRMITFQVMNLNDSSSYPFPKKSIWCYFL